MNILHYSLGLFPDRQGGLVRYSTDLAIEQGIKDKVIYLIPGKLGIIDRKVCLIKDADYKGIEVYKINNALPIPLFAGIKDIDLYTKTVEQAVFENFLVKEKINIIHIHTLMGLYIEFLKAARKLDIPVFMTTHDFFGICPITTLYKEGKVCSNSCIGDECWSCSKYAHSYYKLAIGQSQIYKKMKNMKALQSLRKDALKDKTQSKKENDDYERNYAVIPDYKKLDDYYRECFSLISFFIFNSYQTKEVYENRLGVLPGEVIHLLLPSIIDTRKQRRFMSDGILHIGYLGECKEFKGYFLLEQVVKKLKKDGYAIELDVYNDSAEENEAIKRRGKYTSSQLDQIYDDLDIVAVPSIWYETLSFICLEAIAGGMPCLVSNHVGAKDFVKDKENGIVVQAGDSKEMEKNIINILKNPELLYQYNEVICDSEFNFDFKSHCQTIYNRYFFLTNKIKTERC